MLAQRLVGLDERAPDVAVLDQPVPERQPRRACVALRRGRSRVGHGDHDVGVGRRLGREPLAHALALRVQRLPVHLGVRTREVDVLEHAHRLASPRRHRLLDASALRVADQQLAGLELAHRRGADDVERRRLRGHDRRAVEIAQHERPDAVGIAEREQRVLAQDDRRERTADALHRVHGALGERARVVRDERADDLGVGGGAEPHALLLQLRAQLVGVREVAVVPERDGAAGAVGDDRLRVHPVRRAGRRVAGVPDRRAAGQGLQLALVEDLRDEAHVPDGEHPAAVADGDARALLPAVLERVEREVGEARDVAARRVDAEDAAHQPAAIARGRVPS